MAQAEVFDVSARKFHQACIIALIVAGFVIQANPWAGLLVGIAGVVMLGGRFWWPADVFRQFAWRVLEPSGILPRRDVVEDHATRRVARVLGGIAYLVSAGLLAQGVNLGSWMLAGAITFMVALDAVFDFCVLCEMEYLYGRWRGSHEGAR